MPKKTKTPAPTEVFKAGASDANSISMSSPIIAPPLVEAQLLRIEQSATVHERTRSLESLPKEWINGLLAFDGHKRPVCPATGRLLNDWPTARPPSYEQLLAAEAVGIRTGAITGTLAFDFDGPKSWGYFKKVFKDYPWHVLPPSIAWTSGRDDRRQVGFLIAEEHQHLLENKARRFGDLEFRWSSAASVICGKHPYTKGYSWVDGCAPYEIEIATLPLELIQKLPDKKIPSNTLQHHPQQINYNLIVPLDQFISLRAKLLVVNGSMEGHCNDDSIFVSIDLTAAENWLKAQGVGVDRSARSLFAEYINNCPDHINGKPLDIEAMYRRFEGTSKINYSTATPETTLIERLAFHKRQAKRNERRAA